MNENEILTYLGDRLNLYKAGQLRQLQSPQAWEAYKQAFGKATPNINSLKPIARNIYNPDIMGGLIKGSLIGIGLNESYKNIAKDARAWDYAEQKLREAGLNSQEAFDEIYNSYSNDPHMRGYVGRMFPEYYQDYMRRY